MSMGIEVRNSDNTVIFDDQHLTMRVLQFIKVRDATRRYSPMDIQASAARSSGVVAMVLPHQSAYRNGWSVYDGDTMLATLPVVTVHDGYVRLSPFNIGRGATDGFSYSYTANIDIALVGLG